MASCTALCRSPCSSVRGVRRQASTGLKSRRQPARGLLRMKPMAFTVTLDTPDGEKKIECDEDTYILDAADEAGLDLPYSCRSGSCGTCAAKLASGDMNQIDQDSNSFLEDFMVEKGFLLTCTSYPKADVTLKTDQEENVYD